MLCVLVEGLINQFPTAVSTVNSVERKFVGLVFILSRFLAVTMIDNGDHSLCIFFFFTENAPTLTLDLNH